MRPIVTFSVANQFPEKLARLSELCSNLYWTWNPTIREFLRSIDERIWHQTNHHPLRTLQLLPPERLTELSTDESFLERYHSALAELDHYIAATTWHSGVRDRVGETIAYFSAEFGIHESVPLYSGGLGVLSGDHTKSASDLGLPFVAVGLLYQMGYFQQRLTIEGRQLESYDFNDPSLLPLTEVLDAAGRPLRISVDFPDGPVSAGIWKLTVGRVPIYLLDTNIRENRNAKYRDIADYLYGGDQETRIMQEMILGIGGMRALRAIGINPTVTHSNEGHSAFLMLERTRMLMEEEQLGFAEASTLAAAGAVFTTHTPVPAGHDVFPVEMTERYFANYWPRLGLTREEFFSLGRVDPSDATEGFSMTVLALKLSGHRNGVSQLHAHVSRDMWRKIWPGLPNDEAPIEGITNGVHTLTWLGDPMSRLFDGHLGSRWKESIASPRTWEAAESIPSNELWSVKNGMRSDMVGYVRRRLEERQAEMYTRSETGRDFSRVLDPNVLTIGFARRFATYKRATLLFRDHERVAALFNDPDRPIQMVIAGKAHPKDVPGKEFVKEVIRFIREAGLEEKVVFLEDYDMAVGRYMVQGCDVWLNTPRRPLEASGTSGMKAAINGTLNLSILDGWFPEGYDGMNSFAIGTGREFADLDQQDEVESRQLYRVLEEHVVPAFYDRDESGVPERWVAMQKHGLVTLASQFSADRMVQEYATRFYYPAAERFQQLASERARPVRDLVEWKRRALASWSGVSIGDITIDAVNHMQVGQSVRVAARVTLGGLSPEEVRVEAYVGTLDADGMIVDGEAHELRAEEFVDGAGIYRGVITLTRPRRTGVTVRAMPTHPALGEKFEMNAVRWAER